MQDLPPASSSSSLIGRRRFLIGGAAAAAAVTTARPSLATGYHPDAVRLLEYVNIVRMGEGRRPLSADDRLMAAAQGHADDLMLQAIRDTMGTDHQAAHRGSDGTLPADRVRRQGYRYRFVGENVAAGRNAPEFTVADWIDSPGHYQVMMTHNAVEAGAGFAYDPREPRYQYFWVLVVASE